MVAAQVILTLWAAGACVAFPTRDRRAVAPSLNKNQVIDTVIDELQPEIARAVAEALRLASSSASVSSSVDATGFAFHDSLAKYEKPVYNFELKVSDDVEQTYITHNEERDGNELTGSYSYVDANGDLVTVNYKAGVAGYEETREIQEGVVQIRQKTNAEAEAAAAAAAAAEAARIRAAAEAARIKAAREAAAEAARIKAAREAAAEAARIEAARAAAAEAARIAAEQEAARLAAEAAKREQLIAQIIAAVTPQIAGAVQTAVSSQTAVVETVNTGRSSLDQFASFGENKVYIQTPAFQVEY